MHVSRFDVLVTVTNVSPTLLWMMVPVGWWKTSIPFVIGRLALKEGWSPRADSNRRPFPYQVVFDPWRIREPILAPTVDFGGDHLLRFKTYLGSKRRAHQG
jgi:hypothetical protein